MSTATEAQPKETSSAPAKSPSFEQAEKSKAGQTPDEGVEVVLGEQGHSDKVVEDHSPARPTPDQNVFRGASRPRVRGPYPLGPPPVPPYVHGSGSFGYGHPDYPPRPFPVPPYNPSGSFDEAASYHNRPPSHYSPHVQYQPQGARYPGEDINVISPNHRGGDPFRYRSGPPRRPPSAPSYQYPPASPVSRPGQTASPPRLRNSAVRKPGGSEGPYAKAQRSGESTHPDDGTWNRHPAPTRTASGSDRPQPPLVAESSFDSEHFSNSHYTHPSHPPTPGSGVPFHDPAHSFYGPGSFGSFDTVMPHPPPYGDFRRHHHRPPVGPYPESPYSPYSQHSGYHSHHSYYSPGGYYPHDYGYPGYGPPPSYEDDERGMLKDYHPDRDGEETKAAAKNSKNISKAAAGIVLPAAASEVDFDVHDPPMDSVCPPSTEPLVESMAEVNTYDVLCGRGGGTNSQIGNKRFRKLVQEFQPTYLLARRKEKPLLARSIVLIIRKRGGRFLRKDEETGMLYEVGDTKAEAKTSQALREGLDVRATKSNGLKKKKKGGAAAAGDTDQSQEDKTEAPETEISADQAKSGGEEKTPERPTVAEEKSPSPVKKEPESPPVLPKLAPEVKAGMVHPHSPEDLQFRKRRRMRPLACGADKFFPDFCPPRADLARTASPTEGKSGNSSVKDATAAQPYRSPVRMSSSIDEDDTPKPAAPGCTAAAFEIMTGAVTGGLCFGPSSKK